MERVCRRQNVAFPFVCVVEWAREGDWDGSVQSYGRSGHGSTDEMDSQGNDER